MIQLMTILQKSLSGNGMLKSLDTGQWMQKEKLFTMEKTLCRKNRMEKENQ